LKKQLKLPKGSRKNAGLYRWTEGDILVVGNSQKGVESVLTVSNAHPRKGLAWYDKETPKRE